MKHALTVLAVGAVLASGAQAQVTKQGNGYLLRYKFTKGQTIKFNVTVALKLGGGSQPPTKLPVTMKVVDVKNGIATLKMVGKGMDGKAMDRTVKIDNRGRVQGQKETTMESAAFIELPEKPIPIGGTFQSSASGNVSGAGTMSAKSTFKLASVGMVNGKSMASFTVTGNVTGIVPMKVTGAVKLLSSDGWMWSSQNTASGSIANPNSKTGTPSKFSATSTITRG